MDGKKEEDIRMLTVGELIEYLKTQDPNANVLAFETNSDAYIEQLPGLPNRYICTVAEDKVEEEKFARNWYRGTEDSEEKIRKHMESIYRYAKDSDIVIKF